MSASPRTQTKSGVSAGLLSADRVLTRSNKKSQLFDQFVGANEKCQRHFNPKRLGGLEIYKQLDSSGQLDREISRLGAFENLFDVERSPLVHLEIVRAVCNQRAVSRCCWKTKCRRQTIMGCTIYDTSALPISERARLNDDHRRAVQLHCRNGLVDLGALGYSSCPQLYAG